MSGPVNIISPADRLSEALSGLKLDSSATATGALFKKKAADLRRTIVTIYKNQYSLSPEPWYNHLYSHLACYIRDQYPGQYNFYAPVLDTYPMTSVNMILQPNLINNLEYVFGDDFIYNWAASRYWCDPSEHTLRSGVHFVMTGGGSHEEYMKQYGGASHGGRAQSGGTGDKLKIAIGKSSARTAEGLSHMYAMKALQESAKQSGYQFPSLMNYLGPDLGKMEVNPFRSETSGRAFGKTYLEAALGAPRKDAGFVLDRANVYDNNGHNVIYDYVSEGAPRGAKHVFSENPHLDIVDNAKLALRRRFSAGEMSGAEISKSVEQLYELVRSTRQGGGIHKHIYRSIGKDSHLVDLYKDVAIWLEEERLQKHIGIDQYELWSNSLLAGYRDVLIEAKATLEPAKFEQLIKWLTKSTTGKARMRDALKAAYSDVVSGYGSLEDGVRRAAKVASEAIEKINKGEVLAGGARKKKRRTHQQIAADREKKNTERAKKAYARDKPAKKKKPSKKRASSKSRKPAAKKA
jgi:hypothetical protein